MFQYNIFCLFSFLIFSYQFLNQIVELLSHPVSSLFVDSLGLHWKALGTSFLSQCKNTTDKNFSFSVLSDLHATLFLLLLNSLIWQDPLFNLKKSSFHLKLFSQSFSMSCSMPTMSILKLHFYAYYSHHHDLFVSSLLYEMLRTCFLWDFNSSNSATLTERTEEGESALKSCRLSLNSWHSLLSAEWP